MIARRSSSSSLGPFSMSQWLVSEETEVGDCKAFAPCVVDDSGIPTSHVSQNPLTPKGLANRRRAVNASDVTTVPLQVTLGCSVLTTCGRRVRDGGSSISMVKPVIFTKNGWEDL